MVKVLLVEDSPTQAVEITMLLEGASHEVRHVVNGRQALAVLHEERLDVVVTDLEMPELNGLELVERMRLEFAHIPAILVTGRGSENLAAEALQKGAAGYVPKSHMRALLNDTITDNLGVMQTDASFAKLISMLQRNVYEFELPNDADLISPLVSLLMQVTSGMGVLGGTDLVRLGVAIEQALLNAMFRGNLELAREQTPGDNALIYQDATSDLIESRKTAVPYKDRKVHVSAAVSAAEVRVVVRDDGNGFDASNLPRATDPDVFDSESNRGLVLMDAFADELIFNDRGNEVTIVKRCE